MFSAFLACPDGERGSPVALATDDPVASTNKPGVESFGPCPFWGPSDSLVLLDHFLLELGNFDEPLVCGSQDEGGLASPAMRIRVFDRLFSEEQSLRFKILDNDRVGFSNLESGILSRLRRKVPRGIYWRKYR